ncbi:hypothetical protein Tco_1503992 [Tanacetum coccineum]
MIHEKAEWNSYLMNRLMKPFKLACEHQAINIILQGLPTEIYALVSQHRVAKDLWEKIKLLMQGTSLTKQERECKLYDEFDKFTYKKGESLHEYYFEIPSMILNDMNIYKMPLEQFQINTKFLNTLLKNGAIVYYGDKLLATVLSGDYTPGASGSNSGKQRTVICYNCKGEVSLHGEFISLMNRAELLAELGHAGKTNVTTAENISALTGGFWVHFFRHIDEAIS